MQRWMKWRGTGWELVKKETTINHWCGNAGGGGIPTFMLRPLQYFLHFVKERCSVKRHNNKKKAAEETVVGVTTAESAAAVK